MRTIITAIALLSFAGAASAEDQSVNGYYRKDGTYVAPYHRSAPNGTTSDNYSTQGNVNPYTGQPGTRAPDYQRPTPSYYSPPPPIYTPQPYQSPYAQPKRNPYGTQ